MDPQLLTSLNAARPRAAGGDPWSRGLDDGSHRLVMRGDCGFG